jgi:hypothetical protein
MESSSEEELEDELELEPEEDEEQSLEDKLLLHALSDTSPSKSSTASLCMSVTSRSMGTLTF